MLSPPAASPTFTARAPGGREGGSRGWKGVRGGWPLRISHVASYNVHYKLQTSSSYLLYYYYYHYVCMCILSVKRNRTLKKSRNFICFIFILIVFSFATPTFPPRRCLFLSLYWKKTDHCLSYFRPEEAETQKHVNQPDDLWVRPQLFRKISFCSETEKIVV